MLSGIPLDPACLAEAERILNRVRGGDFDRLRETVPAFRAGGFRPGNTEAFRRVLRSMTLGESPLPDEARAVLSAYAPPSPVTAALPGETLCALRTALAGVFGAPALAVALLLDARAEVRALAESWLEEGFTEGIAPAPVAADAPASSSQAERELRAENRRLAALAAEAERTRNALKRAETENVRLRERLAEAEARERDATRERDAALAECAREVARREERVRLRVEAELASAAFALSRPQAGTDAQTPLPPTPEGKLSLALTDGFPCILLIDGHNTQYGMPSRYNPRRGKRMSEHEKRQRLLRDVAGLIAPSPAVRACVVFDAPEHSETEAGERVRVVFSGGNGDHRADRVLLDQIRFLKSGGENAPVVLLVSDDRDLCEKARKLGADIVPVLEFGFFLPTTLDPSR